MVDSGGLAVASPTRPTTSRGTSWRFFNSDQYSKTASVRSARTARLSVICGGTQGIRDPFSDRHSEKEPASPVSDKGDYHEAMGRMSRRRSVSAVSR